MSDIIDRVKILTMLPHTGRLTRPELACWRLIGTKSGEPAVQLIIDA